jgi:hypothetical protein
MRAGGCVEDREEVGSEYELIEFKFKLRGVGLNEELEFNQLNPDLSKVKFN